MNWTVRLPASVQKTLDGMSGDLFDRIVRALRRMEADPRHPGAVKLSGMGDQWRVRVGDWRILYSIRDRELVVLVIRIGHRREVYR